MILYILILVSVLWWIKFRMQRRRLYELASLVPGSKHELPLLGVTHLLTGNSEDIMNQLQSLSYEVISNNGILKGWLGPHLYFGLCDPVEIEMILKTCLEKQSSYRFVKKMIGSGSISAPVHIWRERRKFLIPMFSTKKLNSFVDVLRQQSDKMTQLLACKADTGPFSIWTCISCYTLDSICETTLGVTCGAQENPNSLLLNSMNRVLQLTRERFFRLWLQPDWLYRFLPVHREFKQCLHAVKSFVNEIIENKRAELKNQTRGYEANDKFDLDNYKTKSLMEILIIISGGEKGLSNSDLTDEVLAFVGAGTDTSAVAIGNVLKIFSKYPEIQERVYDELNQVFGDSKRRLERKDLTQLNYMDCVVKETLRLFPPVPIVARNIDKDIILPSGTTLPAGSGAIVSIWGVHRDPRYWGPNAERFDPDRFLPENFNLTHSSSFIPFSSGPRSCLGYQYAMLEIKISLAAILRNFKVVENRETGPIPKFKTKYDIMMKAVDGYEIALEKRNITQNITKTNI